MNDMLEPVVLHCPYCGEAFETTVDLSAGSQSYIEDCAVCCQPINVRIRVSDDGELLDVATASDND